MATPHVLALCGASFPAFTGNTHIGKTFSLSPVRNTLSCPGLLTVTEESITCSFETRVPRPAGCGVFPSLSFFFFTATYFLPVSLSSLKNCCLSTSCRAHVSLQSAVWFSKCQHTGACLGGGVTPASAAQRESRQSPPGQIEQPGNQT